MGGTGRGWEGQWVRLGGQLWGLGDQLGGWGRLGGQLGECGVIKGQWKQLKQSLGETGRDWEVNMGTGSSTKVNGALGVTGRVNGEDWEVNSGQEGDWEGQ